MGFRKHLGLTLLITFFATTASAGVQMYSAEMIIHTRGSDSSGDYIAVPFGAHCNLAPYHALQVHMESGPNGPFTLTIPKFGGQTAVIDTNSDSIPDRAAGCAPASLHVGLPLTGSGSLSTTGNATTTRTASDPRGFALPKSDISRVTSGASFLPTTWLPLGTQAPFFHFETEQADLRNDAGAFANGGGPGNFSISNKGAKVQVTAGKNRFGGTMRFLGHYRTNRGLNTATKSVGATPWNLQYIGAGAETAMGVVTAGLTYTTMIDRSWFNYGYILYNTPRSATISVFPWTTGMVEVTAPGGPQTTVLARSGYDNRTPGGVGNVQMVSPALTRWKNPSSNYFTGSIATIKLTFLPEPNAWLTLVFGIGVLAILYRASVRGARA